MGSVLSLQHLRLSGVGRVSVPVQEKGHLPSWEALQDPLPNLVGDFQFHSF